MRQLGIKHVANLTDEQIEWLIANYPDTRTDEILKSLPGMSANKLRGITRRLGIYKSPEYIASVCRRAGATGTGEKKNSKRLKSKATQYGATVGAARVYMLDHRPKELDYRESRKSGKCFVNGSTLSEI